MKKNDIRDCICYFISEISGFCFLENVYLMLGDGYCIWHIALLAKNKGKTLCTENYRLAELISWDDEQLTLVENYKHKPNCKYYKNSTLEATKMGDTAGRKENR